MTDILSQDEIDQLLSAISSGDAQQEDFSATQAEQKKVKIYDFKRPDKFSKDQIRTVQMMHETFARLTTTALSAKLRAMVSVHVQSVDQLTYEEFIRSIPNPTTLSLINMDPLKGSAILEVDPSITFTIIDRLFGGAGVGLQALHAGQGAGVLAQGGAGGLQLQEGARAQEGEDREAGGAAGSAAGGQDVVGAHPVVAEDLGAALDEIDRRQGGEVGRVAVEVNVVSRASHMNPHGAAGPWPLHSAS